MIDLPAVEQIVFTVQGKGSIDIVGTLFVANEFGSDDDEEIDDSEIEGSFSSIGSEEAEQEIVRALEKRKEKKPAAEEKEKPLPAAAAAAAKPVTKQPPSATAPKQATQKQPSTEPKKRSAAELTKESAQPSQKKVATEASDTPKKYEFAPHPLAHVLTFAFAHHPLLRTITLNNGLQYIDEVVGKGQIAKKGDKVCKKSSISARAPPLSLSSFSKHQLSCSKRYPFTTLVTLEMARSLIRATLAFT